jgi:alkaline phosphatase D
MTEPELAAIREAGVVHVVQVSDTHLSHLDGVPPPLQAVLDWIDADPPDLVVHSGDAVLEDPDDERDRSFARDVFGALPCPLVAIPGNHDIGFYGEDRERPARVRAFREAWGDDRFALDAAGWRLVGVNAYLLGETEHDAWFAAAVASGGPVAVFVHQPLAGDEHDGWDMPAPARAAFERATADADVRLVASGHRHCWFDRGRDVWAPSATLTGEPYGTGSDPTPGVVEHRFHAGGALERRVVHA